MHFLKNIITVILLFHSFGTFSQTGPDLQIFDLKVFVNPITNPSTQEIDTAKIDLMVNFKILNIDKAAAILIMLGDSENNGDGLNLIGIFIKQNGQNLIGLNNINFLVRNGYEATLEIKAVTIDQFRNYNFLTVIIRDKAGIDKQSLTHKLY